MMRASFFISFLSALLFPSYFPTVHLVFFAPHLVVCFYKKTRYAVLWRSLGCGVLIDLLSSAPIFGVTPLSYSIATLFLYGRKSNFFEDKPSTIPVLTIFFSMVVGVITAAIYLIFGSGYTFSWRFIVTDLLEMPILDGLFALFLFALPFQIGRRVAKLKFYAHFKKKYR
ncbi:MAG: hypothetical protein S4CHLAM45_10020 [Chlamydiales bacterium]|nr:hypothetical protein [Chlamydiales bacterium]MCH9620182.1 hypothetical protein [Chlamydiales bacterium]MCH9623103.1 hypothetical protein [Chlamydiales bacterium]